MAAAASARVPSEDDLNAIERQSGWSRQITNETEGTGFLSEGTWSRLCTEDVFPSKDCAPEPAAQMPPTSVELFLDGQDGECTWAVVTGVADLRQIISEAIGAEIGEVELFGVSSRRALLDSEPIPNRVAVAGVPRFPGGGIMLGKIQFLKALLAIRNGLSGERAMQQEMLCSVNDAEEHQSPTRKGRESAEMRVFQVYATLRADSPDTVLFPSVADMNLFYQTSQLSQDVELRAVYADLNRALGQDGAFLEFVGTEAGRSLIGA